MNAKFKYLDEQTKEDLNRLFSFLNAYRCDPITRGSYVRIRDRLCDLNVENFGLKQTVENQREKEDKKYGSGGWNTR